MKYIYSLIDKDKLKKKANLKDDEKNIVKKWEFYNIDKNKEKKDKSKINGTEVFWNLGKKAENLKELYEQGFNVPDFSVVTDTYFKEVILKDIRDYFEKKGEYGEISDWNSIFYNEGHKEKKITETIMELIEEKKLQEDFLTELGEVVEEGKYYAVRSSSIEEDSKAFSFAGQFETFLYVKKEEMEEKIKKIWNSSFSPHIMEYRKKGKINNEINVPAVIIQEMVNPEKAGVAFSVNPINGNSDEMVISGVFGLGTGIVDGDEDGDLYIYSKSTGKVNKEIKTKNIRQVMDFEAKKIKREVINTEEEVLTGEELSKLAESIMDIEKYYKSPQDMEWAFEGGKLYILQSRPITTLEKSGEEKDLNETNTIIWDNSNIVESYPEITLPLTFSFIKGAYSSVYKQFSKVVGVPEKVMLSYQPIYDNMLGLLKGRVYYNLLNWYKLLLLFPNAKNNSKFMEQMMGVKKELSQEALKENIIEAEGTMSLFEKVRGKLEKIRAGTSLFINMFFIEGKAKKFYALINENLYNKKYNLKKMDIVELKKYYTYLENKFLNKWDIPIINDFLVMIWFGISKKLTEKYVGENPEEVHNILIAQKGEDMVSVEPSKYMEKLGNIIRSSPYLQKEIEDIIGSEGTLSENLKKKADLEKITTNEEFNRIFTEYMEKFGDRTVHELKLESFTLRENPLFFLKMAYSISRSSMEKVHMERDISREQEKIFEGLKIGGLRKYILKKSINYAKKFIKLRENLRYERTKVFGMVRNIMKEMAVHLKKADIITDERDIFYLTLWEVFGVIDGVTVDTDLREIVRLRKKQYEKYENSHVLPDRFLTRGFLGEDFYYEDLTVKNYGEENKLTEGELKGTGCSKGIVKGKVRVVLNPMNTQIEEGDIVVTKSTDPSWVMVFPLISGLIVEKGSLLSHSAIISREMNIPAIVGVTGATSLLKTGDYIQFDGSTGVIRKINS